MENRVGVGGAVSFFFWDPGHRHSTKLVNITVTVPLLEGVCIKYVFALDPWAIWLSTPFTGLALFFLPRPSIFSLGLVLDWITLGDARGLASVLLRCVTPVLLNLEWHENTKEFNLQIVRGFPVILCAFRGKQQQSRHPDI